jgi:uncharacterized protein
MSKRREKYETTYLPEEGRSSMKACITQAFNWSSKENVGTIVMFTGSGAGPLFAVESFLQSEKFSSVRVVAVTPPVGRQYLVDQSNPDAGLVTSGISPELKRYLAGFGIPVVSANFPFKPILGSKPPEWNVLSDILGVFGGGLSFCIQSVLMACDAGEIETGQRVISLSADTAVVALASRTETLLSPFDGLLVEHIICRPRQYSVSKADHRFRERMWNRSSTGDAEIEEAGQKQLPPVPDDDVE